ncbi:MAG: DUF835 domain-containing protein [Thermoplasmatota archaeon]
MKYVMEQGVTYLIKEPKPDNSLSLFASLIKQGAKGFCITRVHPKRIRKRFELPDTPMLWITTSEVPDEKCVHPSDLAKLNMAINDALKKHENLVLLLEGIEYLITYNGFDSILRFVQFINDHIMVTSARFIITLDPATLDTGSLHILERDLVPLEDLSKLELSFPDFPQAAAGEEWKKPLEERLSKWRERGFATEALAKALEGEREEAVKSFEQFEAAVARAEALERELAGMELGGFEREAERIRSRLRDPATLKEAEDDFLVLQINVEKKKKDEQRRRAEEERLRAALEAKMREWAELGFNTAPLAKLSTAPYETLKEEFERFEAAVQKLKEIGDELLLMDTTGFEAEVDAIRSRLNSPAHVSEVEDDIFRLKILIERRRKEERRRREEEERARAEMASKLALWSSEGFDLSPLHGHEGWPLHRAMEAFSDFERGVKELKELEGELALLPLKDPEAERKRLGPLLRDVRRVEEAQREVGKLRGHLEKSQDELRREEFHKRIEEWRALGYNVERLKELERGDLETLQKELTVFKIRVHRLNELKGELGLIDTSGLEAEVAALEPLFRDVNRIPDLEARLTELRLKAKARMDETRTRMEEMARLKGKLVERMAVWASQGYSVSRLEGLLERERNLERLREEFETFEKNIVRINELRSRLAALNATGFEKEVAEVASLLNDPGRLEAAEGAVSALERLMAQGREEARRRQEEEERWKRKAQERILSWKAKGINVGMLERALEEGGEAFKSALSEFSLRLEKVRGMTEELNALDRRGLEAEAEAVQARLGNLDDLDGAAAALEALRAKIKERDERERGEREARKLERETYAKKLLEWASQGLVVEGLEKIIDADLDVVRGEFGRFEKGLRRLAELRSSLAALDTAGFEAEAEALRSRLNRPDAAEELARDLEDLRRRVEDRKRERDRRLQELRARVDGWASEGLHVEKLREAEAAGLEALSAAVAEFESSLAELRRLEEMHKHLRARLYRGVPAEGAPGAEAPERLARVRKKKRRARAPSEGAAAVRVEEGEEEEEEERRLREEERAELRAAEEEVEKEVGEIRKVAARPGEAGAAEAGAVVGAPGRGAGARGRLARKALVAVLALVIVASASYIVLTRTRGGVQNLTIDGEFGDWAGVSRRLDSPSDQPLNPSLNIVEWAAVSEEDALFLYIRTEGEILKGGQNATTQLHDYDTLQVYLDVDLSAATGYPAGGGSASVGAELMVAIIGWDNRAQEMRYYSYTGNDSSPWRPLSLSGLTSMRASGQELEMKVLYRDLSVERLSANLIVVEMYDTAGNHDWSD